MDEQTAQKRLRAVRRQIRSRNLDAMILTGPENVSYLTGFMGHDSWVVIIGRRTLLVTDSRYTEQARSECVGCKIVERKGPITRAVADILIRTKSVRVVGVEKTCSLQIFGELKKHIKVRFKPTGQLVESVRRTKDAGEVRAISAAAAKAWQALDRTLPRLRAGMTESEAAGLLDFEMRKLGTVPGFDTIMAFGANCSRNHHQPGARKLRSTDTILIDFGAKVGGYCSDTTRCFVFGRPTRFYEKVYYGVQAAQQAAISEIRPGARLREIDSAARNALAERGLPDYGHGTGHGIGLQVHETPFLSKIAKGTLQPGDVITVEPGVYIPGKLGVRIEDDILVTETGHKVLSARMGGNTLTVINFRK
ncbi:MAG: aminopeptidase P family protein [Planctomycetes bacterium]|nr:aminopeptidase P family protein [Planctomycetota bacterium]